MGHGHHGDDAVRVEESPGDGHGSAGSEHAHGVSADADHRYLAIALLVLGGFMAAEVVVGILASSLALLADAGHMVSDAGAIALALVAMRLAARPIRGSYRTPTGSSGRRYCPRWRTV
jgi:cobalt-zinc-cadmium efflux system protein